MAQKLYKEEQIKDMLNGVMYEHQIDEFLKGHYIPIELPSDEEIEIEAEKYPYGGREGSKRMAFIEGAKWMRDKILNQKKEKQSGTNQPAF